MFYVTCSDISVIYVTAHRCAGLGKVILRRISDYQGVESKSHPLRGEGENMPVNNGGNNI